MSIKQCITDKITANVKQLRGIAAISINCIHGGISTGCPEGKEPGKELLNYIYISRTSPIVISKTQKKEINNQYNPLYTESIEA